MYKVKNNLVPPYISNLFINNDKKHNLRNLDDFEIPRFNTITYGKHSIRYMGPYIWARISKDVKRATSLNAFKKQIRKLDIEDILMEKCKNCYLCSN